MATYVYMYDDEQGGDTFEITQSMSDDALTECPDTGRPVRRVVTLGGGHRIGGVLNSTSMYNVSGDPGPRRKGYDCDPMN